ncbi:sorting receptor for ubiquitinated membrane protein [Schizosaccharomyces cryophilus OY26]|uniref:Vacuolar protein sorting-associated protein 27 n=1 Tax=Schizosaccharomyces cryophilus (strain OY26 / ATCC MYA-4695 / CBS 11777 / NBRC 106824 / NRRL Y48691) TaxID=653667 RepID=S9X5P5_SCHCR|nr:sorting receptor for ubiquitinated membrane protein [Schizosaccharomyces cryophilus OY26]EPY52362.1 sorting receptor for ubiquitinated membrane protein [Schizosaccharomyces cryophilus OY26]
MSGWWNSNSQFAVDVEKATSETLPAGAEEIALNLEISDQIRSKSIDAKSAMRILKSRIDHSNPNVQLLALKLCDTCLKNGGLSFVSEVASREFMDNLVSILHSPSGVDEEVEQAILFYIQCWALAVPEKNSSIRYILDVYEQLKGEDYSFPEPPQAISSSFLDTSTPPEWTDSQVCLRCRIPFTFTNRKHHCRNCGGVFCNQCSSKTMVLPQLGINTPVRVCESCYASKNKQSEQLKLPRDKAFKTDRKDTSQKPKKPQANKVQPSAANKEDEDLKRAIQLSLREVEEKQEKPSSFESKPPKTESHARGPPDDEDDELKRAIEISLQEAKTTNEQNKSNIATETNAPSYSYPTIPSHTISTSLHGSPFTSPRVPQATTAMISHADADNITLYATLVEKLKKSPPGSIFTEYQLQELHENMGFMRTKMMRSLGETISKYNKLLQAFQKLQTCMRLNDALLDQRLSSAYRHHPSGSSFDPPQNIVSSPRKELPIEAPRPVAQSHSVREAVLDRDAPKDIQYEIRAPSSETISNYYNLGTDVPTERLESVRIQEPKREENNEPLAHENIDDAIDYYNIQTVESMRDENDSHNQRLDDNNFSDEKDDDNGIQVQEASLIEL